MSELVLLHHNEPVTTSLAIAEGVEMEHHSVLVLLKKHVESLSEFGRVEFEIQPFDTNGGRQWRDVYFLNEQQATLLVTFMRNSPLVIKFKVALVRAFFELRDKLAAQQLPQPGGPLFLSHAADIMVAADRTFRAVIRSGRTAGLSTAQAIRRANEVARIKTGVCMLDELQAHDHLAALEASRSAPADADPGGVLQFWADYEGGNQPCGACIPLLSTQAHQMYTLWTVRAGFDAVNLPRMVNVLRTSGLVRCVRKRYQDGTGGVHGPVAFLIPSGPQEIPASQSEPRWLGTCVARIQHAMKQQPT